MRPKAISCDVCARHVSVISDRVLQTLACLRQAVLLRHAYACKQKGFSYIIHVLTHVYYVYMIVHMISACVE